MRGAFAACLLLIAAALPARVSAETQEHIVFRDGQPVGSYRLEFVREGEELVVGSELTVDIRLGFLPIFTYRFNAREVWRGDRLVALDSETYDNGKRLRVAGRATPAGFLVDGTGWGGLAPADIRPTSFWRKDAITQTRLLDSETGKVLRVTATLVGEERSGDSSASPMRRYLLSGQLKHDVELGYAGDRWVSARFRMLGSDIEFRADTSQLAVAQ
jgi:Domain of unknown function (DUF6134)